jgi:hypothetical protein
MAIIDSVKASSDIYCAASGEVAQVNEELLEHPELINQSPYESGWIAKIKLSDLQEFEKLMTKEQYDEFVGGGGEMNKDKDKDKDKDKKKEMPPNQDMDSNDGQEEHKKSNNNNNNQSSRRAEHRLDR